MTKLFCSLSILLIRNVLPFMSVQDFLVLSLDVGDDKVEARSEHNLAGLEAVVVQDG